MEKKYIRIPLDEKPSTGVSGEDYMEAGVPGDDEVRYVKLVRANPLNRIWYFFVNEHRGTKIVLIIGWISILIILLISGIYFHIPVIIWAALFVGLLGLAVTNIEFVFRDLSGIKIRRLINENSILKNKVRSLNDHIGSLDDEKARSEGLPDWTLE